MLYNKAMNNKKGNAFSYEPQRMEKKRHLFPEQASQSVQEHIPQFGHIGHKKDGKHRSRPQECFVAFPLYEAKLHDEHGCHEKQGMPHVDCFLPFFPENAPDLIAECRVNQNNQDEADNPYHLAPHGLCKSDYFKKNSVVPMISLSQNSSAIYFPLIKLPSFGQ